MARLFIAVGYADRKATTLPQLVYLGREGVAMRTAIAASHLPVIGILNNPLVIPKHNGAAAANLAAKSDEAAAVAELEITADGVTKLRTENAAHLVEIKRLHEELATAKTNASKEKPGVMERLFGKKPDQPPSQ